jgi:Fe2+ or Zn2+ uptake regulation protein
MAKNNKDVTLFDYEMNHVDGVTGEVTSKTATKVVKRDRTPDFIMLFTAGAPLLRDADLSKREQAILNIILGSWITTSNRVEISTTLRKNLSKQLEYSLSTVYKGLNSLQAKGIFVERVNAIDEEEAIDGSVYLNPHIFGRGHWNDIKKLRYDIQVDFDFEELEARTTSSRTVTYNEAEELLEGGNLEEVDRIIIQNSDNTFESEIIVEEKKELPIINIVPKSEKSIQKPKAIPIENETNLTNEYSLKIIQEKNKSKELDNKAKQLDNEAMGIELKLKNMAMEEFKMKIEAKKLGIDF